ncbi:deoxyribonuclease TATDN1 [Culicoides brevitarsis]|uniref:deoxyribonuclease TATDN1 n=1 Tax=Culicoides brevitarsis TaxID=469753 RepID=UPI00307C1FD8
MLFKTLLRFSSRYLKKPSNMKFIDIGANLTDTMFQGIYNGSQKHIEDLNHVLQRSWNTGLEHIIVTVGSKIDLPRAKEIIAKDSRLSMTVGIHPTRCNEFIDNDPDKFYEFLCHEIEESRDKVSAVGELGLDYDRLQFCEKETQKKYFEKQLDLADKFELPLFLHCRAAHDDLFEILSRNKEKIRKGGVVHTFDGTLEQARAFMEMGLYIGINGCSLKTEENVKVAAEIPNDRILLETDAPWCEIRPTHAGSKHVKTKFDAVKKKEKWLETHMIAGRCEPAQIIQVLEVLSGVKNIPVEELSEIYYQNTLKLFSNLK